MSQDLEDHPTEVSYRAGVAYAKRNPNADRVMVNVKASKQEDDEAFKDGFYNTVNK